MASGVPTQAELLRARAAPEAQLFTLSELEMVLKGWPKGKATGGDQWSPRSWRYLPAVCRLALLDLIHQWQRMGSLPHQWATVVCLLPKPTGGTRPIALCC
eukprot:6095709-Amphidinium_carterae.1